MKSPIYNVTAIPFERIIGTFYTSTEMTDTKLDLLYKSIKEDGYTSPILCFYDKATDSYCILDGYYRYRVMRDHHDIYKREGGMLPVCVLEKPMAEMIVSAYRHNLARGIPDVHFTSMMIKKLCELGKSDEYIKKHLGLDEDYLKRFRAIKSFAELYAELNEGENTDA